MNQRIASGIAFAGSVAAAMIAAGAMTGNAWADDITMEPTRFVSSRSRAEVRDETLSARKDLLGAGGEIQRQSDTPQPNGSSLTRAQVRDEYIAAREEVMARNSEIGSSFGSAPSVRVVMPTVVAGQSAQ